MASSRLSSLVASDLERPLVDDRKYRVIRLANRLEALLIQDEETDKASAALDVNVGSYSDPRDLFGLAHFCEHLLFMGTEKYPVENEYSQYLSEHSGHSNAYTAAEETNYYFEVAHEYLEGALDRFAQFFVSPLFSADCKDREIRAVDSENKKNLQSDSWRLHQLDRWLSNPLHPYNKFSTGNLVTLDEEPKKRGVDVRDELLKFYKSHYSANLMKLVVIGRESLDTLEDYVSAKFSAVPNLDREPPVYDSVPLTAKELGKLITAMPVMDTKHLILTFPVPDQRPVYTTKPSHYYSHLIGHEGPGSLLHYFKSKEWANGLSVGSEHIVDGTDFFLIDVELTNLGLQQYQEVLIGIFEYLKMLAETPAQKWVFHELKDVASVDFKFRQRTDASVATSRLAAVMQKPGLPREHLLSLSVLRDYDAKLIDDFVKYLVPSNFRILLTGQALTGLDMKEKWYGTMYSIADIDVEIMSRLTEAKPSNVFHFPAKNDFIPTNFEVSKKRVDEPAKHPTLIKRNEQLRVWHKKDDRFWIPKANVYITLTNPFANATPANSVKTAMFVDLVNDALVDFAYNAEVAGLRYDVVSAKGGIEICVCGYNHKLLVLVEKILDKIKSYTRVDSSRFNVLKERSQKTYKNFGYTVPYNQIGQYTFFLLNERTWHMDDKSAELDILEAGDMDPFINEFLRQFQFEILVLGNMTKEEALRVSDMCVDIFKAAPLVPSQRVPGRSFLLPYGNSYYHEVVLKDEKNINSCIDYTVQTGLITEDRKRATLELFAQIASEPVFNQLRTKEQLGYVVFGGVRSTRTTMGYRILIQSERITDYLEERIDNFLTHLDHVISNMSEEDFQTHVEALIARKLEKRKNLKEEAGRYWTHITSGYYNFLKHEIDANTLRTVTKKDVLDLYHTFVSPSSSQRAKIVVHLKSQSPPDQTLETIMTAAIVNLALKYDLEFDQSDMVLMAEECKDKDMPGILAVLQAKLASKGLSAEKASLFLKEVQESVARQLSGAVGSKYPEGIAISDVGLFKAQMPLTGAPTPVKDLSSYLETTVKL
jgi:insulysin